MLHHEPIDWTGPDIYDQENTVSTDTYKPTIPTRARDIAYIAGLVLGALTTLALGIGPVWLPEYTEQIKATVAAVNGAGLLVIGGLGTIYRPGAQS